MRPGAIFASVKAPMLSSHNVVWNNDLSFTEIPIPLDIARKVLMYGMTLFIDSDNATYSDSIVDKEISCWSLLTHITGQLERQITKPVRLLTQLGSCLSSCGHRPAKSESTYTSVSRFPVG